MKPHSLAHVLHLQAQTHAQPNNQSTSVSDPLLQQLLLTIADCCSQISDVVHNGALGGILGSAESENVQGETQKQLDIIANDLLVAALSKHPAVAGLASEEMDDCINTSDGQTKPYLVLFDPLDGSSNIDVNVSIGTIFSILPAPETTDITNASFLQHGRAQVAAGYVVYGPQTTLVLTLGNGVMSFTLDRSTGLFYQAHERMVVPKATREFAINMSNQRHWYAPVQRYIAELLAGQTGPREKDFNMRWVASMVADVHRVLSRGGIFMYPKDQRDPNKPGKLRLMYEANPMSFLVEQAGGLAFDHTTNILDITPTELHQRCSVALGSSEEVARLVSICQG